MRWPIGLAFDAKNRKLFSVCSNRVMAVSDPDTGKVVAAPAIGAGSDGVAFDPGTGYAFSLERRRYAHRRAAGGGKWEVLENIAPSAAGGRSPWTKTHRLFVPTAKTAPAQGNARPIYLPDTFKVLVVGK